MAQRAQEVPQPKARRGPHSFPGMDSAELSVDGEATAYRLFDIGYEIDLERAARLLGAAERGRSRPARLEARALEIRQPPLSAALGERELTLDGHTVRGRLAVHLFAFGVCSLRFSVSAPAGASWADFTAFGAAFDRSGALARLFESELETLLARVRDAVVRPGVAPVVEDYVVFRLFALRAAGTEVSAANALTDEHLRLLLLGERRALASAAQRDLLGSRFSYYADDLAVLTWDNALIADARGEDTDVEYVLEFANAQLLELRVYDAQLDAELPALYDRIAAARRRPLATTRRFRPLLGDMQTRVADVTEIVERAENAFKVTDDVYLARIYERALELFRVRNWRSGVDRKLSIFRETYAMLNGETQATRNELLELAIVLLIVFDIVLGFTR